MADQWPEWALMALRMSHTIAGGLLLGAVFFNYVFLLPALKKIPVTQQIMVNMQIGTSVMYLSWSALAVLLSTGILRLYTIHKLPDLLTGMFWTASYGRWLAVMMVGWIVVFNTLILLTFILRPVLVKRLAVNPTPTAAIMQLRRNSQMSASTVVDRVHLINLVAASCAVIAGSSLMFDGII